MQTQQSMEKLRQVLEQTLGSREVRGELVFDLSTEALEAFLSSYGINPTDQGQRIRWIRALADMLSRTRLQRREDGHYVVGGDEQVGLVAALHREDGGSEALDAMALCFGLYRLRKAMAAVA